MNFYIDRMFGNKLNWWSFYLLPTVAIERRDMFADEAAYYIGVTWLMLQIYIVIRKKK